MFIAAGAIAYLFYTRESKQLRENRLRFLLLLSLRSLSLFLIALLLLGLLFESKTFRTEKPVFVLLIDNSSSMLNSEAKNTLGKKLLKLEENLSMRFGADLRIEKYLVGDGVKKGSVNFTDKITDLNEAYTFLFNRYYGRNLAGICLVSDGNFNRGLNPLYMAKQIPFTPNYTLGVGDTITKRDHLIQELHANKVAFLGNKFPIEVQIRADKLSGRSATINLFRGNKLIEQRRIVYDGSPEQVVSESFVVEADKVGFVQYSVILEELKGEYTLRNNTASTLVEVIDDRSRILLLAGAPHPDISAIKQALERNDKLEVESLLGSDWDKNLEDVKLVFLSGLSNSGQVELASFLRAKKIPIFYLLDTKVDQSQMRKLALPVKLPERIKGDEVQVYVDPDFTPFETKESLADLLSKAPPLLVPFGETELKGDVLLRQRIGAIKKSDPVLSFLQADDVRSGILLGEGIWRWRMQDYLRNESFEVFDELMNQCAQYLMIRKNTYPLQIIFPEGRNELEEITLFGEFYNPSMEKINTPSIDFELTNPELKNMTYQFAKNETDYRLNLGKLMPGTYHWKASARHGGKQYQTSGVFVIDPVDEEQRVTKADHFVLQQLANQTGGVFQSLTNYDEVLDQIADREDLVPVSYAENAYHKLIDLLFYLFLLMLLLGVEWFLRRYYGAY